MGSAGINSIPCHARIDFVDPANYPTREIAHIGCTGSRNLLRRIQAARAHFAVEDDRPLLVEPGNFVRDVAERDEPCPGDVSDLPLVWLAHVDDLELLPPRDALRELRGLNFGDSASLWLALRSAGAKLLVIDQLRDLTRAARWTLRIFPDRDRSEYHRHRIDE